eukprot:2109850-Rhodomonas_salina.1
MPPRSFLEVSLQPAQAQFAEAENVRERRDRSTFRLTVWLSQVVDPPKKIEVDGKWFGPAQEGGGDDTHYVWAIPVRINCNVQGPTAGQNFNIENFAKARQDLILSTVDQAIMEVREELSRMSTDS